MIQSMTARLGRPAAWSLAASVLLFLASMPLDSFCIPGTCSEWPSYALLFMGWLNLYAFPSAGYVWLANPALLLAWLFAFTGRKSLAVVLSLAALALSASFLRVPEVLVAEQQPPAPVVGYGAGYWLWLASCAAAFIGAALMRPEPGVRPKMPAAAADRP